MPLESTAENPLPVRTVANAIGQWIARLGQIWVEGQLTEISKRPGTNTAFLTLRDPIADMSLQVTCPRAVVESVQPPLDYGARVAIWAKPEFYPRRGSLSLTAIEIRPIGVGELLARIERLKTLLAAEGLFAPDRKQPLPFLPRSVGLICGRGSAAERDVVENAKRRWPAVHFTTEEVAVQGPYAVNEVIDALARLDKNPEVDVIVITRGGGSVEDLLPFSDEAMCRAVSACRTPVVSAIGHEPDSPLIDHVADFRASTPTDAGKKVVPDVSEELAKVTATRDRGRRAIVGKVDRETTLIASLRSRPVMGDPDALVRSHSDAIDSLRDRARRRFTAALDHAANDLDHTRARVVALSPAATLERGYAVVQRADGSVVRDPVVAQERLTVRVAGGRFDVTSIDEGAA